VRTKQLLRRLDAHMDRGNQLFERNQAALDENRQAFLDLRSFLRELTLRHERGLRPCSSSLPTMPPNTLRR
jgi:hypothetical protein